MGMKYLIFFLFCMSLNFSFPLKNLTSSVLDFVPGIGNIKSVGEAIIGNDIITGEELSVTQRALSLLGGIPGVNYFKNAKYVKNAEKFFKASKRAQKAGKIKNFINFLKAGIRSMNKANKVQNSVKNIFKAAKSFLKLA